MPWCSACLGSSWLLIAQDRELIWRQAKIDQLTHELSLHKRWRFGVKTERLPVAQAQLFEETVEADLAAMTKHGNDIKQPSYFIAP